LEEKKMHLIVYLIIGGIAGWLAGKIMSGHGYGPVVDIILGVVGGFVAGWLISVLLGVQATGLVASFVVSLIGACLLVAIVHMFRREPLRT
jgi:uncharacterized membrane protein YeaQ/YmgE (transglycosylase-associated protein family)